MAFCPNNAVYIVFCDESFTMNVGRWAMGDGRWAMGDGRWAMGGLKTKFENFAPNFAQQGAGFLKIGDNCV